MAQIDFSGAPPLASRVANTTTYETNGILFIWDGSAWNFADGNAITVEEDDGSPLDSIRTLNFTGEGVVVTRDGTNATQANIAISGGRGGSTVTQYRLAVSIGADGTVTPSGIQIDYNANTIQYPTDPIPDSAAVEVNGIEFLAATDYTIANGVLMFLGYDLVENDGDFILITATIIT